MKKILLSALSILILVSVALIVYNIQEEPIDKITEIRKKHEEYLKNSPFKETKNLSKKDRKAKGLPPNSYSERQWELTMDPQTGTPQPDRLFKLQDEFREQALFSRVPGENTNDWVERGPDNVGGRTRAIMYDPNDVSGTKVFAGGVSGGLWVNGDITDVNSAWALVDMPQNLAISCITYDPNNTMTFYVGTGESYVSGDVNGNGVWKSTNGGVSWARVLGGITGETDYIPSDGTSGDAKIVVNSPGGIAGDYYGLQAGFGPALTPITGNLVLVDDGSGTPEEGCAALVNGGAINGNIAVLYRGSCEFGLKVLNAENAGAVAVIVINNAPGALTLMGAGVDGGSVTIPSLMVSQADGATIAAQLGSGVNVSLSGFVSYAGYLATPGVQHINDIKVRDIGSGNSEVYVAAGSTFYSDASPSPLLGAQNFGLYKSIDDGSNWSKFDLSAPGGYDYQPNDIEISADNTIWVSTTNNLFRNFGGEILSSTDGVTFTLKHTVANGSRTQIAVSGTNAGTLYVLAELSTADALSLIKTTDAFATAPTVVAKPAPVDTGQPANDFTRGQAFYDLMIEVDPTDDGILYVGGVDLYRTINSGSSWNQISKWSNNNALGSLGVSTVHADQHILVFDPNDSNKGVFGNDGGVSYASSLSAARTSTTAITAHNKNYNTLQFYKGAIGQEVASEKLLAGAQDNGSQLINNASAGIGSSVEIRGGDGAYVFIDKDNEYMISSYVFNSYSYANYTTGNQVYSIDADQNSGDFINPSALDSDNNFLITNGTVGTTYQFNGYVLGGASATLTQYSDALLDGAPSAFKALAAGAFNAKNLYLGTDNGKLFHVQTNFSGADFTEITGPTFVGSISCIETGATEDDIYVTFYNYGATNVFYSDDAGSTWSNKEGNLPDLPVRAIMTNPLNRDEVILGTDLGVWGTPDFSVANPVWSRAQNGMKDVIVTSFDLRTADNTVLASTYGRGMFTGQFTAAASELSTDDLAFNDLIKIYPTVSDGNFKISAKNEIRKGDVKVFDINGREVYSSKLDFNSNPTENISINASSGMYIVKFSSENRHSTQKIIIE